MIGKTEGNILGGIIKILILAQIILIGSIFTNSYMGLFITISPSLLFINMMIYGIHRYSHPIDGEEDSTLIDRLRRAQLQLDKKLEEYNR